MKAINVEPKNQFTDLIKLSQQSFGDFWTIFRMQNFKILIHCQPTTTNAQTKSPIYEIHLNLLKNNPHESLIRKKKPNSKSNVIKIQI